MKAIITTKHKGVFYGEVAAGDKAKKTIDVKNCRMAIHWPSGGVVGLAAAGPPEGSRLTEAAPTITLHDVTAVMKCSKTSEEQWARS